MSPTLKDAVPIGSLEARIMKYSPPTTADLRPVELVSRAYKVQGFSNAADKILAAASRLEEEAAKEKRYWEQILAIKQKGWSITKIPRDSRTHRVHFGFRDAAPSFRNRGFAALRRNADGGLRLDQGAIPSKPVTVQVSIVRDSKSCSKSSIPQSKLVSEGAIDEQILQARNTLYEEELFHELGREARLLANQGATMSSKQIKMPLNEQTQIRIDLINLDHDTPSSASGPDQHLAEGIAIALRILLSHAHEENLRRRSQPPPPMTLTLRSVPEYALLRPIITHLQHQNRVKSLTTFLQTITKPLSTAGIPCTLQPSSGLLPAPLQTFLTLLNQTTTPYPLLHPLITTTTTTTKTPITLTLPTSSPSRPLTLTIHIHTSLHPPTFGTEYTFRPATLNNHPFTTAALTLPPIIITTTEAELQALIRHILTLELVALISSASANDAEEEKRKHKEEPSACTTNEDEDEDEAGRWMPLDPQQGSLARGDERIYLRVWDTGVGVRYLPNNRKGGEVRARTRAWAWAWDGGESGEMDVAGVDGEGNGSRKRVQAKGLLDIVGGCGREKAG